VGQIIKLAVHVFECGQNPGRREHVTLLGHAVTGQMPQSDPAAVREQDAYKHSGHKGLHRLHVFDTVSPLLTPVA